MATIKDTANVLRRVFHGQTMDADIDESISDVQLDILLPEDALAADATNHILFEAKDNSYQLLSASICAGAVVTQAAVNYAILDLSTEDGAAGGLVSLDLTNTETGVGGTLAARVPRDFTIVPATDLIPVGSILVLAVTKNGAGVVVTDLHFRATLRVTD